LRPGDVRASVAGRKASAEGVITIIIISGVAVLGGGAVLTVAMGRAAARADEELDELLARRRGALSARELRESSAGLALAPPAIAHEPAITVRATSTRAAARRSPASSATSRLPRVWL
jgi:hypothetical protein